MARPTNRARVLRLLEEYDGPALSSLRNVLGPGCDSAILDLIEERKIRPHLLHDGEGELRMYVDLRGDYVPTEWGHVNDQ